jgi:hypothetical protein
MALRAGITVHFKVENSGGRRIQELFVVGRKLDRREIYGVCFLMAQGVPGARIPVCLAASTSVTLSPM